MISKDEILDKTNRGLDVFKHYLGIPFRPGKNFRNPLYEDRNASCNIYFDKHSRTFRMKDFGDDSYSGDCFWFVATLKGLDMKSHFTDIIDLIVMDLHLPVTSGTEWKRSGTAVSRPANEVSMDEINVSIFKIENKPFSNAELDYWHRYGIHSCVLEEFHVTSVNSYESVNRSNQPFRIQSSEADPVFAYNGVGYVKLYRPLNRKFRFIYGGQMPDVYCFGLEQLPNKGDIVFITGGEKDVMTLYANGFHAICFNSETATIPTSVIEMLERKFRHIFMLYDADETGKREALRQCTVLSEYNVMKIDLPLSGSKKDKDISDYFASGKTADDFRKLITESLEKYYSHTLMLLKSCEMDYNNPPRTSKTVVSVNNVPLGTYDNLLCITGGEGTGKSNFVSAIIAGTLSEDTDHKTDTLGLDIMPNYTHKSVLHYDTEQSEYQLFKNLAKTMKRCGLETMPPTYHTFYLASMSRKERLQIIRDSMDLYYHRHGGIHLVVIDGIADLIRSANDESESVALVDELYRLAGIYNTCIICVLHFVPNGIKLRGHIGSELQRKAAAIISIEKDDNPAYSVVKALKVRDGSPLDVPMLLFTWDKGKDMHVFAGEKPVEDKEKRKKNELVNVARDIFRIRKSISYNELAMLLMDMLEVKDRTAKNYIQYMRNNSIISQDINGNYTPGDLCSI